MSQPNAIEQAIIDGAVTALRYEGHNDAADWVADIVKKDVIPFAQLNSFIYVALSQWSPQGNTVLSILNSLLSKNNAHVLQACPCPKPCN